MSASRQFTTREHIEVIAESGFSAEGLKIAGSPWTMRAVEDLVLALCDMVLNQRAQVQRVRVLIDTADRFTPPLTLTTAELRRALDGDGDVEGASKLPANPGGTG